MKIKRQTLHLRIYFSHLIRVIINPIKSIASALGACVMFRILAPFVILFLSRPRFRPPKLCPLATTERV